LTRPPRADICIVGAGAAGLALAHGLGGSGRSVLLVESGPGQEELNEGEVAGHAYNGLARGRVRGVGGTTAAWPGQCMRLDARDFEHWPLASLDGWYERAEELLGLTPGVTARDPWELFGEPEPGFTRLRSVLGAFAHRRRRMAEQGTSGAELLTGTTVTRVERGRVETTAGAIEASTVVVAAGALETTRLLIASGFRQDGLGRCFQDHAACFPARVVGADARALQDRWDMRLARSVRYQAKLLGDGCMATFVFDYGDDAPLNAALRLRRGFARRDLVLAARGAPQLASAALRVARGRMPAPPPEAIRVLAVLEQPARTESALTLSDERDSLGMPRLRVDWRVGGEEGLALAAFVATLDEELRDSGAGALDIEDWVGSPDWHDHAFDAFHPSGTTALGTVVDENCRIDDGIYVCSGSVFPTSGCANPTLTILALALRLADHLRP
jgi:choline dehydrogenase-like flavoprotein